MEFKEVINKLKANFSNRGMLKDKIINTFRNSIS